MSRSTIVGILAAALIPSALIAWYARDMPHLGGVHDDTIYWVCAKSLAEGSGYRIVSLPGQPFQTKYPPLYPLVLSLVWKVNPCFPQNLPLATALCWAFLPVYLVLVWKLFPELGLTPPQAAVACVLLALNPFVVLYGVSLMSELPFCCLLFGSLLLLSRAARQPSPWWLAATAGALGAAAFLTRTSALPLLAAGPLWLLWRRRFAGAAIFVAVMAPFVVGWNLWARAHLARGAGPLLLYYTDYTRYHFANFAARELPLVAWRNALDFFAGIGSVFVSPEGIVLLEGSLFPSVVAAAALLALTGLAVRKGIGPYHLFAALYAAMLLPWELGSVERVQRLFFPLFPLLIGAVVAEFARVWRWLLERFRKGYGFPAAVAPLALAALGFAAFLSGVSWVSMVSHFPGFMDAKRSELAQARPDFEWMASRIPPDRALLADADPLVYLHTGRRACGFIVPSRLRYFGSPADVARFMESAPRLARAGGISYLVLGRAGGRYIMSGEFLAPPPGLRLVYESRRTSVYDLN